MKTILKEVEVPELKRERWQYSILMFLVYWVQKTINNAEGISRMPVRTLLRKPASEGGFGMNAADAGDFFRLSLFGWYIKAFMGLITDNIPLFGYRRKSWLMLGSLGAGVAWFAIAAGDASSADLLLVGLIVVNVLVAFSDVVCDGLMVATSQSMEAKHGLVQGEGSRPLQAAQWTGAFTAMVIAAIGGGIIAQFFNLRTAAIVSGILPIALMFLVAFVVKEERVSVSRNQVFKGLLGIVLIVDTVTFWVREILFSWLEYAKIKHFN